MTIFGTIKTNLDKEVYGIENIRFSQSIGVIDGNFNVDCRVIEDDIFNADSEKIYRIEQHIGNNQEYFTYDIFDYKLNYVVESKTRKD